MPGSMIFDLLQNQSHLAPNRLLLPPASVNITRMTGQTWTVEIHLTSTVYLDSMYIVL